MDLKRMTQCLQKEEHYIENLLKTELRKQKVNIRCILKICKKNNILVQYQKRKQIILKPYGLLNSVIRDTPRHTTYPQYFSKNYEIEIKWKRWLIS